MAHDEKTKADVRRYYVFDCLTLEQAAEKAKVSYNTARRWKKEAEARGDNWDTVRDANTMASGKVEDVARGMLTHFGSPSSPSRVQVVPNLATRSDRL